MKAKLIENIEFERGQEPREAMNLGMMNLIKNFLESIDSSLDIMAKPGKTHWPSILLICLRNDKYDFADFILDEKNVDFKHGQNNSVLRVLAYNKKYKALKYLINKGVNLQSAIRYAEKHSERETLRNFYYLRRELKESIDFEQNIEPRKAMGIGRKNLIKNIDFSKSDDSLYAQIINISKDYIVANGVHYNLNIESSDGSRKRLKKGDKLSILDFAKSQLIGFHDYVKIEVNDNESEICKIDLWHLAYSIKSGHLDIYDMNESIDFERGIEPKDAMDIGLKARAFPIIAINMGFKSWFRGIEAGEHLKYILKDKGSIPPYSSITVIKDPSFKGKISGIWNLKELKKIGYSGIKWAHIFLPFEEKPFVSESIDFERRIEPKDAMDIGLLPKIKKEMAKDGWKFNSIKDVFRWASYKGNLEYVKFVRDKVSLIDEEDIWRWSIEKAAEEGYVDIVDYLIQEGADSKWISGFYIKYILPERSPQVLDVLRKYRSDIDDILLSKYEVNESIEFERGIEPHKAMKVGDKWKIWNISKYELYKIIRDDVFKSESVIHADKFLTDTAKKRGFDNMSAYYDILFDEEGGEYLDKNEDEIIKIAEQMLHTAIKKVLEKYPLKDLDSVEASFFEIYTVGAPSMQIEHEIIYNIDDRYLRESIDFERGIDPKEAMGIGSELYRKNREILTNVKENFPEIKDNIEEYIIKFSDLGIKLVHINIGLDDQLLFYLLMSWVNSDGGVNGQQIFIGKSEKANSISKVYQAIKSREQMRESINFERGKDPKVKYIIKKEYLTYFASPLSTVYESIEFERGQEPREAMGIGRKDLIYKYKLDKLAKKHGFNEVPIEGIAIDSDDPQFRDIAQWEAKDSIKHDKGILFYEHLTVKNKKDPKRLMVFAIAGDTQKELSAEEWLNNEMWVNFFDPGMDIDESIEFERGLEPSKAMDIGMTDERRLQHAIEKYDIPVNALNYDGINAPEGGVFLIFRNYKIGDAVSVNGEPVIVIIKTKHDVIATRFNNLQARFNESIEFERGIEPSKAMNIGYGDAAPYINEIDKIAKKLGFKRDDISITPEKHIADLIEWRRRPGEIMVLYKDLRNNAQLHMGLYVVYYESEHDSGSIKAENWIESGWISVFNKVDESIDFERGIEPSKAMTIGNKAIAEKKAKEIDWDWYPQDEGLKEEVIDVVEHHGEDIKVAKILVAKSYSGKDIQGIWKYYAVSSVGEPYLDDPSFYETSEEALQKTKDWIDDYIDEQGLNFGDYSEIYKRR